MIIAENESTPIIPKLEIVIVPPWYSSGFNLFYLAFSINYFVSKAIWDIVFSSAFLTIGVINPLPISTANPTSTLSNYFILSPCHYWFASGTSLFALATAFIIKSLTDILVSDYALTVFLNSIKESVCTLVST